MGTKKQGKAAARRELLSSVTAHRERAQAARPARAAAPQLDYPSTKVGSAGNVTVLYASSLGDAGAALAGRLLKAAVGRYDDLQGLFGVTGSQVKVILAPLSGQNDGSGGAYHYGCDFMSGGDLYVDATFAASVDPLQLAVGLYVAELSESFMGAQDKGWGCGFSNGEALSRYCAERATAPGTLDAFATGPDWDRAGRPDWISTTEQTDGDAVSTGCGMVYIYWMRSLGTTPERITQAGGATLADNYKVLTGKTTAYRDLLAALQGKAVTSDDPFSSPASPARR